MKRGNARFILIDHVRTVPKINLRPAIPASTLYGTKFSENFILGQFFSRNSYDIPQSMRLWLKSRHS